jgi:hypothetical protein
MDPGVRRDNPELFLHTKSQCRKIGIHAISDHRMRQRQAVERHPLERLVTVVNAPTTSNSSARLTSCSANALSLPLDHEISAFGRFCLN